MDTYFVRSRGKLAGPFEIGALQQLIKRAKLTRFDQISTDKMNWQSAGDLAELFTPAASRRAMATVDAGPLEEPNSIGISDDGSSRHRAQPSLADQFFYAQNGSAVGPVPIAVLQTLATNGTLKGDDPVWADGSEIATPAWQVPMLASFYSRRTKASSSAAVSDAPAFRQHVPRSVASTQLYAKIVYFIVASLTLVFSLLPVVITNGRAFWWWDGNGELIAGSIYSILAAVALLIITPLTAGLARPLVALALIGVPTVLGLVFGVSTGNESGLGALAVFAVWGTIVFTILLTAVCQIRPFLIDGGPLGARLLQIIMGALTVLASVSGIILLVVASENWSARSSPAANVVYGCTCLGVLANLSAGVLAIISGKPRFDRVLNRASMICVSVGGGAFAVAAIVAIAAFQDALRGADLGTIGYAMFRGSILLLASTTWLSASFRELLAWCFRESAIN